MWWVALVFFVSMVGARAVVDVRDLPHDRQTRTRTLATVYGISATRWILPAALSLAATIALYVHTLGAFDRDYLIWTLLAFAPALAFAWSFALHPTPNYAFALGWPYWTVGILYMLALVLEVRELRRKRWIRIVEPHCVG
jgi:4-hydroxybenzoate polyprenyltransferase